MNGEIYAPMLDSMPDEIRRGIEDEIRNGWQREAAMAEVNNRMQGVENRTEHRSIEGLGRLRMQVDPTSYNFWGQKLGYECWRDKQFLREYERDTPDARVVCRGTGKIQVGFGSCHQKQPIYHKAYAL
jgi:hypothetical protein